jgi:Phage tail assembly chaperone proteins, E, or 41 or 14
MKTIKLSKPTKINGSELTELNLDLESLRGRDLLELETGFRRLHRGEYIPVLSIDARYQVHVAGRCCGVNPEDLGELYAPDFAAMCAEVQSFLLSGG